MSMKLSSKLGLWCSAGVFVVASVATLPSFEIAGLSVNGNVANAATAGAAAPPQMSVPGCKRPPAKRKLKSLGQKFFKKVENIDALTNPEVNEKTGVAPEPNFKRAWPMLKKLIDRCDDCSEYEWAQLYQRAAFLQFQLENIPSAISYFQKVVSKSPNIPVSLEASLLYQIGQLLSSEERYSNALTSFNKWETLCPGVVPEDYFYYRAQIHYQMNKKDLALASISKAIKFKEGYGAIPKERWLKLQLAIYADKENYKAAESVAEKLVVNYTSVQMLGQLASIYGLNSKEKKQLAMLDALNVMNGLSKEREFRNLAYLYLSADVPYLASRVLKKGFKEKKVERTSKNLEVYAASLSQSQEVDQALPVMEEAAQKSDKGKLYATLAAVYLDAEKYKESIAAGKKALKKGGLRSPGEVHMFMGSAYMYMEKYDSAIASLRKALSDEKYTKYAQDLISYVKRQKKRDEDLRKAKLKV